MGISEPGRRSMNGHRVVLLESQAKGLEQWLTSHPLGHERGAIILFRRFSRTIKGLGDSYRFCAVEIIKMGGNWIIGSSKTHLEINMRRFPEIYHRCESENLELGFVHYHPSRSAEFSDQDGTNEQNIMQGLAGCNGSEVFLVPMLYTDQRWAARVLQGKRRNHYEEVRHIAVIGEGMDIQINSASRDRNPRLSRQEVAFGNAFNDKLQSLRVAVVGVGGTGSVVATSLARAGIGELIIIDGDLLEESNLNRVVGYLPEDVGKNKADSLAKRIDSWQISTKVKAISEFLQNSEEAIDSLSSADIVFGCTDDHGGRDILNQSVYYYGLALIDCGLTGFVDDDEDGIPYLRDHRGRVSCIMPESGTCLNCQGVIKEEKIRFEEAIRLNPSLADKDPEVLQREYYLVGGGEDAPGVGPFTAGTANFAVATMMNLIRPFQKTDTYLRRDNIWVDFVHLIIHSNQPELNPNCIYCEERSLLLKAESGYRLDMPSLGRIL